MTVKILGTTTRGDQILDQSLSKIGGKGLFVKELKSRCTAVRLTSPVHSLKDVPMNLPDGFALACVTARENAQDAFISKPIRLAGRFARRRRCRHLQPAPLSPVQARFPI